MRKLLLCCAAIAVALSKSILCAIPIGGISVQIYLWGKDLCKLLAT